MSHVRLAARPEAIHSARVASGQADLLLGCDLMVAAGKDALAAIDDARTRRGAEHRRRADRQLRAEPRLAGEARGAAAAGAGRGLTARDTVDASRLATALMGDAVATNVFMLGFAWQKGLIPLQEASLLRAIELNGAAVEMNKAAFAWGRQAARRRRQGTRRGRTGQERTIMMMPRRTPTLDALLADRTQATDRLSERGLRRALRSRSCARSLLSRRRAVGTDRAGARGRREPVQADGLQRRVRSRAPVRRVGLLRQGRPPVRGRLQAQLPPGAAAAVEEGRQRPPGQEAVRAVDGDRVQVARQGQGPARHGAGRLRLHARSAAPSAR